MLGLAELCSPSQPPATPSTIFYRDLNNFTEGEKGHFFLCVILQVEQLHLKIKVIDGDQRPLKLNQTHGFGVFFFFEKSASLQPSGLKRGTLRESST